MCADHLVINSRINVALKMPSKIPAYITRAKAIHSDMSRHSRFSASAVKLAKLEMANNELFRIQVACKTKPPTELISTRNAAKDRVAMCLRGLRNDVQTLVNENRGKALVIISEANMVPQFFANNKKFKNRAIYGGESGSVILYGEGRGYHNWQISTDRILWEDLETTSTAKTLVEGLKVGKEYHFRNRRVLTKGRKSAWSQIVSLVVR